MEIEWTWYIVAGFLLMIFEIFVPGFILFPAGVAFVLNAAVAYFVPNLTVQLISLTAFLVFVFLIARKYVKSQDGGELKIGAEALLGKFGIVQELVDPLGKPGSVSVEGEVWKAKSGSNEIIPAGKKVLIMRVDGIALVVSEVKE